MAVFLAGAASAAGAAVGDARWYLQVDNDVFMSDRWYTSGLRLARTEDCGAYFLELGLLHEIYTPEAKRFAAGVIDRAPTARALVSAARHDVGPGLFQTLELDLGVRGPAALGRQLTRAIHRLVPAGEVDWSRQESNRVDAQLAGVRTHRLPWLDVHYGAVLGNQVTFAHAGAELRLGARGASSPLLRYASTPPLIGTPESGWGTFLGASIRGVARNEMLRRPYSASGAELGRRNGAVRAGGGVSWSSARFAATLSLVQESREFEGQRAPHRFGSLTVHADF